ncbi:MAG: cyclic pyranopterin monophosphate synthase MoaC [Cellulosilyticaceae bacterium]
MSELTHFDNQGNAIMVDVSDKQHTQREAVAVGAILVNKEVMQAILDGSVKKGDVLGVARVAGMMGVKATWNLIPMCHPLMIQKCHIDFEIDEEALKITVRCLVKTTGQTGVEMEALSGVSVTLLTIYDMCKAIDKTMTMTAIHVEEKKGGKSGHFINKQEH